MNAALPPRTVSTDPGRSALNTGEALGLYRCMRTSRRIDELEQELVARGEAFFHVGAAGHEASAALAPLLQPQDFLHCHYRDKALMLARGMPVREFFDSLLCNAASHSGGRQMSAHLSAPALRILSTVGPVGNNALQAVGVAQQVKDQPGRPIVLCSLGDGTTQQGEVLEAIAEAVRSTLPVLFLVQDNRYAISTHTAGQTFFSLPSGEAESFYGLAIHRVDGSRLDQCHASFGGLVRQMRQGRGPALCVMAVERLSSHTNADDETAYRGAAERSQVRAERDPLANTCCWLLQNGVGNGEIDALHAAVDTEVRAAMAAALDEPAPRPAPAAASDAALLRSRCFDRACERRDSKDATRLTMAEALREALRARMAADARVTLYGQDIEDPKGDVFGVTRGLTAGFPGRVRNAPLSESTIIGASIGRALAGGRPVAFLQFADFLPLAFNQLATELATMAWRTQGGWHAPLIVLVSCGAYRPGLGPFHAQTFDSALAHLPGIDVLVPSNACDAAGMLNAAFVSERPTVMLYPKALLHARSIGTSRDVAEQWVPIGAARVLRPGNDLTLVGWGNTVGLCLMVAEALADAGRSAEVIDLRCLAPWDRETVLRSVARSGRLLVVHEDNRSAGFGAEVVASVVERGHGLVQCRRVTREDSFVPCNFGLQLAALPSYRRTLEAAADMLELDVRWAPPADARTDRRVVHAIGSSPADQTVEVVELPVRLGQDVEAGQIVASVEADKAVFDIAAPANGTVIEMHLHVGDRVLVDTPLLTLAVAAQRAAQPSAEAETAVRLLPRPATANRIAAVSMERHTHTVALRGLGSARGMARLDNADLALLLPGFDAASGVDGILQLTGIESRCVAGAGQDAVSMAVDAARLALREAGIRAEQLSLVICSTSTPLMVAPSTACQVMHRLAPHATAAACDVQAACSGYLYALGQAWDFLQQQPQGHVLVLTTEHMRRVVDMQDAQTSPIFGDAATATVLSVADGSGPLLATLRRPLLGARGNDGSALRVPLPGPGAHVQMDGKRVFVEAVRTMCDTLAQALALEGVALDQLDLVVPHQANGRIIEAMRSRLRLPEQRVWNEVRRQGNTSSSSIPLALDTVLHQGGAGRQIGLCTFGAGYTFGAALLRQGFSG
jgi:2-oxoisovalerate dehydrogenase E1 component